jgi:hypothetical protein
MTKRTIAVAALTGLSLAIAPNAADAAKPTETLASDRLVNVSSLAQLLEPIPDAVQLLQTIAAEGKLIVAQKTAPAAASKTVAPATRARTVPKTTMKSKVYQTVGSPVSRQ